MVTIESAILEIVWNAMRIVTTESAILEIVWNCMVTIECNSRNVMERHVYHFVYNSRNGWNVMITTGSAILEME